MNRRKVKPSSMDDESSIAIEIFGPISQPGRPRYIMPQAAGRDEIPMALARAKPERDCRRETMIGGAARRRLSPPVWHRSRPDWRPTYFPGRFLISRKPSLYETSHTCVGHLDRCKDSHERDARLTARSELREHIPKSRQTLPSMPSVFDIESIFPIAWIAAGSTQSG